MSAIGEAAIEAAHHQSEHGPQFGEGECMKRTRMLFGAPAIGNFDGDGDPDAEDGWKFAKHKHPTHDPSSIPRGVPVWWGGGSKDNGHVAVSTGHGKIWSTDIKRTGFYDQVDITRIHRDWKLPLLGWSEDIDGVTVYTPDPVTQPPPVEGLDLVVWQVNTHRGRCLHPDKIDDFARQVHDLAPDVVALCEVTDPDDWKRLHGHFADTFDIYPGPKFAHTGKWAFQTPILLRKARFDLISQGNPLVSKWLGGGHFGQMWPTRFSTRVRVRDHATNRVMIVHSVHHWFPSKSARVAAGIAHQIDALVASVKIRGKSRVVIAPGDYNQNLNNRVGGPKDIRNILGNIDMVNASRVLGHEAEETSVGNRARLDDLFYREAPFVTATDQRILDVAGGSDHRGVLTTLKINPS